LFFMIVLLPLYNVRLSLTCVLAVYVLFGVHLV
jgi:hypothetical protein